MKRSSAIPAVALLGCLSVGAQQAQLKVPDALNVTVDTQQSADPVSKYVFGSFIEHIGTLIYRSVWAEMLDDRKFYFPITRTDPRRRVRKREPDAPALRKWRPVGADHVVVMDKDQPFVGDQSPKILTRCCVTTWNSAKRVGR